MKVQVRKIDDCQRILEIEIAREAMQEEFEVVINRFLKNTVLPGFRLGKVPRELLLSRFGKDIEAEVIKNTIPYNYSAALKETNLWPLGEPEISKLDWKPNTPLVFEAKVEVKPEIKLGQYKGLVVKKATSKVIDADVDAELGKIQEKMAAFNSILDRPLAKGDLAVIDLDIYVDEKIIPGGTSKDFYLEVEKDLFGPGFDDQLVGLKIGEKKVVEHNLPPNHPSPQLQNKKAFFHISLKEIREKKLPAIDDELARRLKDCKDLDDLKEKLRKSLMDWKEKESLRKTEEQLIGQLLKSARFPLPNSLIERRKETLLHYTRHRLEEMGFSEEKIKAEEKGLDEEARKKAEDEIKLALILEAIAEKENIIVSQEEAKEELKKIDQYSKKEVSEEEINDGFIEQVRHNKALNFLMSCAKVQVVRE